MIIDVKTSLGSYDIVLERGALEKACELLNLNRKVLVVTDSGVPEGYSQKVLEKADNGFLITIPEGEASKNMENLQNILKAMILNGFTRTDCVVAVGGGVVGDMAGFAASVFMRGIDFYNIPTTVLSQVDSSIGGKTAIDFMGIKNIVGAFYPPKKVIIDADTLKTLPQRQISNGLCEALKMSATFDSGLFKIFEEGRAESEIDRVLEAALKIKKAVVEEDEREGSVRKVLNFGHTLAHAIESANNMQNLYHGECVAIGMLPMAKGFARERILKALKNLNLPTEISENADSIISACRHDKKASGEKITVVLCEKIGTYTLKKIDFSELEALIKEVAK